MSKSDAEPVLITGMHRSGTSALAVSLRRLGLFTGWDLDRNAEARFFVRLDDAILHATGARWDHPSPCVMALREDTRKTMIAARIVPKLDSILMARYVGPTGFLSRRFPWLDKRPWGWKDPRLVFTLPLWRSIFPKLRVIHLTRHGVDVAASLARRSKATMSECGSQSSAISQRCSNIEGAFSLWEEYMRNAASVLTATGNRAINIRFEELVQNPRSTLSKLAAFCGLSSDSSDFTETWSAMDKTRAFAFRNQSALVDFARAMRDRLAAWGYRESE